MRYLFLFLVVFFFMWAAARAQTTEGPLESGGPLQTGGPLVSAGPLQSAGPIQFVIPMPSMDPPPMKIPVILGIFPMAFSEEVQTTPELHTMLEELFKPTTEEDRALIQNLVVYMATNPVPYTSLNFNSPFTAPLSPNSFPPTVYNPTNNVSRQ